MDFDFMLFAAENEGDIPTRYGRLCKIAKLIRADGCTANISYYLMEYDLEDITDNELDILVDLVNQ